MLDFDIGRMKKTLRFLLYLACISSVLITTSFWFGYIEIYPFKNIVESSLLRNSVADEINYSFSMLSTTESKGLSISGKMIGALLWPAIALTLITPLRFLLDVSEAGSLRALYKEIEAESKAYKESRMTRDIPVELGRLTGYQVSPVGILSSCKGMIETELGMFTFYGYINSVEKGARVYKIRDKIYIDGAKKISFKLAQ